MSITRVKTLSHLMHRDVSEGTEGKESRTHQGFNLNAHFLCAIIISCKEDSNEVFG